MTRVSVMKCDESGAIWGHWSQDSETRLEPGSGPGLSGVPRLSADLIVSQGVPKMGPKTSEMRC